MQKAGFLHPAFKQSIKEATYVLEGKG